MVNFVTADKELSILVVDDQPQNLTLLETGLNDLATIICCQLARHAFAMAVQHSPALILLDIEMPDGDGLQICQSLKNSARTRHIPIIFITAHRDIETETKALSYGAIDFIARPLHLNVCRMRIFNHLKLQQQARQLASMNHKLQHQTEQLHIVLNAINDGVVAVDKDHRVSFINPVAQRLTGFSASAAQGKPVQTIVRLEDASTGRPLTSVTQTAMRDNCHQSMNCESKLISREHQEIRVRCSASPTHDDQQRVIGAVLILEDVSLSYQLASRQIHLANHDPLTGLPNRLLLHEHLHTLLQQPAAHSRLAGIMVIDIDNFRYVNDMLGHERADTVICQLARRLATHCDNHLSLYKVGGDEFIFSFSRLSCSQHIVELAERTIQLMQQPVIMGEETYSLSCSIGISVFGDDAHSEGALLRHGETAMYRAKSLGRNRYCFFCDALQSDMSQRLVMEKTLKQALEEDSLEVVYQPQFCLSSNRLCGAEALVRLPDQNGTLLPPAEFIPLAEETGLIYQLGEQVLQKACVAASGWLNAGRPLKVAVNIAAAQFNQPDFYQCVVQQLSHAQLPACWLELEITESALLQDFNEAFRTLTQLRKLGIRVALDDFGTGYSSLSYLRSLPLDAIKIDRSFIQDMLNSEQALNIVTTIVCLAENLNLHLVAEGIESQAHQDKLSALGCTEGQGYWLSKPLSQQYFEQHFLQVAEADTTSH